jgi:hypothetical protein
MDLGISSDIKYHKSKIICTMRSTHLQIYANHQIKNQQRRKNNITKDQGEMSTPIYLIIVTTWKSNSLQNYKRKKKLDLEIPEENHGFGNLIKFETL